MPIGVLASNASGVIYIEAARKAIAHSMSKSGKIWVRIFPDHPYTQKPAEVKMGKGKGELEGYVAIVKPEIATTTPT